jgi:hypothetical protein
MGRQPDSTDKLFARAAANGYERGKHVEKDADPGPRVYVEKTVYDQDRALHRYVM